ncbi:hypothetical protein NL676_033554 [Syzygium grande]|nr:hypothetical protein NL676_033554 [Syzygium grande]
MSVVGDNDDDDAVDCQEFWPVRKTRSAAILKMDTCGAKTLVVDWWITMLHVMIALGRTCVYQQHRWGDGRSNTSEQRVVKVVWSRDGATFYYIFGIYSLGKREKMVGGTSRIARPTAFTRGAWRIQGGGGGPPARPSTTAASARLASLRR